MKILVVLPRFPYPLEKGDKLRAYNQIRVLSQLHEVHLFCLSHRRVADDELQHLRPLCKSIHVEHLRKPTAYFNALRNFALCKSVQIGYWDSKHSRTAYRRFERKVDPDVVYSQMVRTMPLVAHSQVPKVMDFQDALSVNMLRRMESTPRGFRRFLFHFEFKMLRSSEYNAFDIFDALTIISEGDSNEIPHRRNGDIHIVPNGVDFDYFKPMEAERQYDIVFCGNMQYEPNVKASVYLVQKVMPLVWKEMPQARLLLAGATPTRTVRRLASDRVVVSGTVDDIRQCYASAQLFAAPMHTGSGLQNKLLEAMAMHRPCVTTSLANSALGATPDRDLLIGDTPQAMADHIVDLLQNAQQRERLVSSASEFVHSHFSWETTGEQLAAILKTASDKKL